jgi:MOSC domain-containing protein YiiM
MAGAMTVTVNALLAGKAVSFARGEHSAIDKKALNGPVNIGFLGIDVDEQSDKRYHGGPDKALHHYPFDHYAEWAMIAPRADLLSAAGAFGENISIQGLTEETVYIGDQFRLGTLVVEISQGRQPCWKQGVKLIWPALPALMVKQRRCGWYYRVIEEGIAQAGDELLLLDRPLPDWSVHRVIGLLLGGDHKTDKAALKTLAQMEVLYDGWRARAAELLNCG